MLSCTIAIDGVMFVLRYAVDDEGECELNDIDVGGQSLPSDMLAPSVLDELQLAIVCDVLERRELAEEQAAQASMWWAAA